MQIRVLFFASLKDIVGQRDLRVDVPPGGTIADLLSQLESKYPRMKDYRSVVLTAINEDYVNKTALISEGDEVAIFPPVSGGSV
jgi:molybdopterin converting factor subunit 1